MKNKSIASLILVTLAVLAVAAICVAQSTNHLPASLSNFTLGQHQYMERFRAFTGASNLSDAATSALINDSLKTNAAVQVWARMHFSLAAWHGLRTSPRCLGSLKACEKGTRTTLFINSKRSFDDRHHVAPDQCSTMGESDRC